MDKFLFYKQLFVFDKKGLQIEKQIDLFYDFFMKQQNIKSPCSHYTSWGQVEQALELTAQILAQLICNCQRIVRSVHFKKTVLLISILSELCYFQYKSKQKVLQF